ncbi:hypothetical protein TrST_g6570 [Triparma strigata]|uniref:WW domain-containing protein n=1 Tax=Triparma strigata TaxID=1606541 RepID=A0A9W7EEZ9_9STRA|nr:hypothetical protein TrST_g6570 [Triparma strigata]
MEAKSRSLSPARKISAKEASGISPVPSPHHHKHTDPGSTLSTLPEDAGVKGPSSPRPPKTRSVKKKKPRPPPKPPPPPPAPPPEDAIDLLPPPSSSKPVTLKPKARPPSSPKPERKSKPPTSKKGGPPTGGPPSKPKPPPPKASTAPPNTSGGPPPSKPKPPPPKPDVGGPPLGAPPRVGGPPPISKPPTKGGPPPGTPPPSNLKNKKVVIKSAPRPLTGAGSAPPPRSSALPDFPVTPDSVQLSPSMTGASGPLKDAITAVKGLEESQAQMMSEIDDMKKQMEENMAKREEEAKRVRSTKKVKAVRSPVGGAFTLPPSALSSGGGTPPSVPPPKDNAEPLSPPAEYDEPQRASRAKVRDKQKREEPAEPEEDKPIKLVKTPPPGYPGGQPKRNSNPKKSPRPPVAPTATTTTTSSTSTAAVAEKIAKKKKKPKPKPPAEPPPPPEEEEKKTVWIAYFSEQQNKHYYENEETRDVQWAAPPKTDVVKYEHELSDEEEEEAEVETVVKEEEKKEPQSMSIKDRIKSLEKSASVESSPPIPAIASASFRRGSGLLVAADIENIEVQDEPAKPRQKKRSPSMTGRPRPTPIDTNLHSPSAVAVALDDSSPSPGLHSQTGSVVQHSDLAVPPSYSHARMQPSIPVRQTKKSLDNQTTTHSPKMPEDRLQKTLQKMKMSPKMAITKLAPPPKTGYDSEEEDAPMFIKAQKQMQAASRKMEKLRREKFEQEMAQHRAPRINKVSQKLVVNTKSIAERTADQQRLKEKKLAQLQQEKELREAKETSFRPKLATGKKRMKEVMPYSRPSKPDDSSQGSSVRSSQPSMSSEFQERQAKHLYEKEAKRKEMEEAKHVKDMKECDFKPMLAPKSKKLVAAARKKEAAKIVALIQEDAKYAQNGVGEDSDLYTAAINGDVGARLTLQGRQQARKKEMIEQQQTEQLRAASNPAIDKRSKTMARPGSFSSRLYDERKMVQKRQEKMKQEYEESQMFDPKTGQKFGAPKISSKSQQMAEQRVYATAVAQTKEKMARGESVETTPDGKTIVPNYDVANALINRGKAREEKLERMKKQKEEEELKLAQKSKVSKTSQQLAARRGTTKDRLYKTVGNIREETLKQIEEEKPTFQPVVNAKLDSPQGAQRIYGDAGVMKKRTSVAAGVMARNEAWVKAKEERARKTAEARKQIEDAEWTFKPKVKNYVGDGGEPLQQQGARNPRDVAKRAEKWHLDREKKLEQKRKEAERNALNGYTFKPNMRKSFRNSPKSSPENSPIGRGGGFGGGYSRYADESTISEGSEYVEDTFEAGSLMRNLDQGGGGKDEISNPSDIFNGERNSKRRGSVKAALQELDDFMAIETSVLHHDNSHISGISSYVFDEGGAGDDLSEGSQEYYGGETLRGARGGGEEGEGGESPSNRRGSLPAGWLEFVDPTGKKYYHNALTNRTQWEPPVDEERGQDTPGPKGPVRRASYDEDEETDEKWMEGGGGS